MPAGKIFLKIFFPHFHGVVAGKFKFSSRLGLGPFWEGRVLHFPLIFSLKNWLKGRIFFKLIWLLTFRPIPLQSV